MGSDVPPKIVVCVGGGGEENGTDIDGICMYAHIAADNTLYYMKKTILTTFLFLVAMAALGQNKTLVAFFSRAGENYAVGYIEKGNTQIIAEMIADKTGGKLFHIVPVTPYPVGYSECVDIAKAELNANARPAIQGDAPVEQYDTIFIGYPNWWGDLPMPVYTFLEKHKWQGKTVIPFCTHEGSGLGGTTLKLKNACIGANVLQGIAIQGVTAQQEPAEARKSVEKWLQKVYQ